MESYKIDWFDLAHDVIHRLEAGDMHPCILGDLYYGIEAELATQHLNAQEVDIEYLALEFFVCMRALCGQTNLARWKKRWVLAISPNMRPMWLFICRAWLKDIVPAPTLSSKWMLIPT